MKMDNFCKYEYSDLLNNNDILICALGYESRSYYLLMQNLKTRNKMNTLIIAFDDLDKKSLPVDLLETINFRKIKTRICSYSQGEKLHNIVLTYLKKVVYDDEPRQIFIDYSSMPRNWYCYLPFKIDHEFSNKSIDLIFLYVAGIYPASYESFPTAGIDCLKLFYGRSLPKIDSLRTHLIALSYDVIRTQSILSILEPEFLITCYAYDSSDKKAEIENVNEDIIRRSSASIAFPTMDFVQILQKLNGIIYDQTRNGQIVIIPDGPKPLIFAMSIISILAGIDEGITCFHISRNEHLTDNKINVCARENNIYGVKISLLKNSNQRY